MPIIDGWTCTENPHGAPSGTRTAKGGAVAVTANHEGFELDEYIWEEGEDASRYHVPANVMVWLMQAVR